MYLNEEHTQNHIKLLIKQAILLLWNNIYDYGWTSIFSVISVDQNATDISYVWRCL